MHAFCLQCTFTIEVRFVCKSPFRNKLNYRNICDNLLNNARLRRPMGSRGEPESSKFLRNVSLAETADWATNWRQYVAQWAPAESPNRPNFSEGRPMGPRGEPGSSKFRRNVSAAETADWATYWRQYVAQWASQMNVGPA